MRRLKMCAGSIEQSSLIYTGCPNRSVAFLVVLEGDQPYTLLPARATGVGALERLLWHCRLVFGLSISAKDLRLHLYHTALPEARFNELNCGI
jgi:hypothetical protein